MKFPLHYKVCYNFSFTFSVKGNDSLTQHSRRTAFVNVNAYGSINTPAGTFECLRMKVRQYVFDGLYVLRDGQQLLKNKYFDTLVGSSWFSNSHDTYYNVANYSESPAYSYKEMIWSKLKLGVTVPELEPSTNRLSAFPIPAIYHITVLSVPSSVQLFSIDGEEFFSELLTGALIININNYPAGIYVLKAGAEVMKVIIRK